MIIFILVQLLQAVTFWSPEMEVTFFSALKRSQKWVWTRSLRRSWLINSSHFNKQKRQAILRMKILNMYQSGKLTWQWKSTFPNWKYIYKWWIFHAGEYDHYVHPFTPAFPPLPREIAGGEQYLYGFPTGLWSYADVLWKPVLLGICSFMRFNLRKCSICMTPHLKHI